MLRADLLSHLQQRQRVRAGDARHGQDDEEHADAATANGADTKTPAILNIGTATTTFPFHTWDYARNAPFARRRLTGPMKMDDTHLVTCPYCGEEIEIYVEPDVRGSYVQDCEVCCNPWTVRVQREDDELYVEVGRADGSE